MNLDVSSLIQGIILLGAGALTPYLLKIESRLKRLETKDEQRDKDEKKIDKLFDKIDELKTMVMNLQNLVTTHISTDNLEKSEIHTLLADLKKEVEDQLNIKINKQ
jgi:hypothetical protein